MANGSASSLTVAAPRLSRATMRVAPDPPAARNARSSASSSVVVSMFSYSFTSISRTITEEYDDGAALRVNPLDCSVREREDRREIIAAEADPRTRGIQDEAPAS